MNTRSFGCKFTCCIREQRAQKWRLYFASFVCTGAAFRCVVLQTRTGRTFGTCARLSILVHTPQPPPPPSPATLRQAYRRIACSLQFLRHTCIQSCSFWSAFPCIPRLSTTHSIPNSAQPATATDPTPPSGSDLTTPTSQVV